LIEEEGFESHARKFGEKEIVEEGWGKRMLSSGITKTSLKTEGDHSQAFTKGTHAGGEE